MKCGLADGVRVMPFASTSGSHHYPIQASQAMPAGTAPTPGSPLPPRNEWHSGAHPEAPLPRFSTEGLRSPRGDPGSSRLHNQSSSRSLNIPNSSSSSRSSSSRTMGNGASVPITPPPLARGSAHLPSQPKGRPPAPQDPGPERGREEAYAHGSPARFTKAKAASYPRSRTRGDLRWRPTRRLSSLKELLIPLRHDERQDVGGIMDLIIQHFEGQAFVSNPYAPGTSLRQDLFERQFTILLHGSMELLEDSGRGTFHVDGHVQLGQCGLLDDILPIALEAVRQDRYPIPAAALD